AGVAEQTQAIQELVSEHGGMDFAWADRPEERSRLWQARHDAYYACLGLCPGARSLTTDVCVPISRLAECIAASLDDLARTGLVAPLLGHVGDGNFHMLLLVNPEDAAALGQASEFAQRLAERAIAMDGTCTGEHGIGLGKRKYMVMEHGTAALTAMRAIKQALDPHNLMNPGKILPD
ncbi:MAG: FAD-linked oxidase C-terminal domain-containing protein, partial [Rhodocyclaceae bacterium]|nr:FAD-linked oxidase C-terminal domain-containing protein [Rhodocyclaceae bacterium]